MCRSRKDHSSFYQRRKIGGGEKKYMSAYCKQCEIDRIAKLKKILRAKMLEYGGGSCTRCGYSRCLEALEFHHRDKSEKDFHISKFRSLNASAKKELDKCDLLCANCHREAHYL